MFCFGLLGKLPSGSLGPGEKVIVVTNNIIIMVE